MFTFTKAHGLGNDFVIIDLEQNSNIKDLKALSRKISNRRLSIGCDQILFYKKNQVWFFNADGTSAESCGNGVRCLAKILMQKNDSNKINLITPAGDINCKKINDDIQVQMPNPAWDENINIKIRDNIFMHPPIYVNVGNPHLVCFVNSMEDLKDLGPILSRQFSEGANVGFVIIDEKINLCVWERGTGITPACGSGACAAAIACHLKFKTKMPIKIYQEGGELDIDYSNARLLMTGPCKILFEGKMI